MRESSVLQVTVKLQSELLDVTVRLTGDTGSGREINKYEGFETYCCYGATFEMLRNLPRTVTL